MLEEINRELERLNKLKEVIVEQGSPAGSLIGFFWDSDNKDKGVIGIFEDMNKVSEYPYKSRSGGSFQNFTPLSKDELGAIRHYWDE